MKGYNSINYKRKYATNQDLNVYFSSITVQSSHFLWQSCKYVFSKNLRVSQNSKNENWQLKQVPYWGHKNTNPYRTEFSGPGNLVPGMCAALAFGNCPNFFSLCLWRTWVLYDHSLKFLINNHSETKNLFYGCFHHFVHSSSRYILSDCR